VAAWAAPQLHEQLERLEQAISLKRPRMIVCQINPKLADEQLSELLKPVSATDADWVVCIKVFGSPEGHFQLGSISALMA
jgi:hypothetical protein